MNELLAAIRTLRSVVRWHRDQRGDDRCWLDDARLYEALGEGDAPPTALPPLPEMMAACTAFYRFRRAETADPVPSEAVLNPTEWDQDLERATETELEAMHDQLKSAIRTHRDIKDRPRTIEDDRVLYAALPERVPADFRLPPEPEFLGGVKPGTGCPNFWQSHVGCGTTIHEVHRWGPCPSVSS